MFIRSLPLGAALSLGAVVPTLASGVDPSLYGKLDVSHLKKPQTIHRRPVVADSQARKSTKTPIYVHLAPGQEQHWASHCSLYAACNVPVYFVTEGWFMNVYLPEVGARDGREQDYRLFSARDRGQERDRHDQHGHD